MRNIMGNIINAVVEYVQTYNWDNPMTFGFVILGVLAVFGKWRIIFITVVTYCLGMLARDLIIWNMRTMQEVITVPDVIYSAGGIAVLCIVGLSFIKYMLSS